MKRKLTALLAGLFVAFSLAGCGFIPSNASSQTSSEASASTESTVSSSSTQEASTESSTASSAETSVESSVETSAESSVETSVESSAVEPAYKDYTSFTAKEKTLFNEYFSEVIPFIPNNEYYVEEYSFVYEEYGMTETGINFYTVGNTEEEFESYKEALDRKYELESSEEDEYGDMWYYYNAEEFYIDVSYYYYEGDYIVDVYAYVLVGEADDSSTDSSTDSSDVTVIPPEIDFGGTLLTLYGLKDGESVTGEFTLTGKIISLDDYNNPTIEVEGFEDMPVYCYRLQLPNASIGDIITVTATTMKNYQGTYEFMNCTLVDSGNADSSTESSKDSSSDNDGEVGLMATLAFDDTANRLSQNDDEQIWEDNGVKLINSRHESSQPIKDYSNPIRLYANTSVTIEYAGMTQISFACNDYKAEYPTDLVSSIGEQAGVSVSVKGSVVTVVFATERNSFSFVLLKQVRLNSLTVYTGSACESDSSVVNSSDVTVIPPEVDSDFGEILLTLYGLKDNESVTGEFTLTGKIISLDDYNNPTIVVEGFEDMPVYCYKLRLPDASIGDIITVTATTMKNYQGTYEFMNCTLVDNQGGGNGGGSGSGSTEGYTYTEFTTDEKALFNEYFGEVIPFIPNNEYYAEAYTIDYEEEGLTEVGVNFYTFGNTQAEFNAYKAKIEGKYEFYDSYEDEYGDTWYSYDAPEYCIDICYYQTDDGYVVDVYAYFYTEYAGGGDVDDGDNGGNTTDVDLITNEGKGLPTGEDGVYNVDFTKATYAKNVTELGLYEYGCPTEGSPSILVIPVEFSDATAASKGYTIDAIKAAFNGGAGETDYYSVHDYYYISSYGKLDLNFTVLDTWFRPEHDSAYYANATIDYFGTAIEGGDQLIMDEALAFLDESMNLSAFDTDGNTCIDAIVMINTLDINGDVTFQWAYRYWNVYSDADGYYYEYDGVSANDYLWASYQFLLETYDEVGNPVYEDTVRNTYTYIHEFGHVLGADDYYDTSYVNEEGPLAGCDIMDSMLGDHNAYTKFNYGWLTNSRLVVAEESVTLTLEDFSKNGDTIIIANNWDETLGVYQEYYIVAYYTNNGLNADGNGYFSRDGVVVYHVNASLYGQDYGDGTIYYNIYNNNTDPSDSYGTEDNLIEYIKSPADTYTYIEGDSLSSSIKDDQGNQIAYTFTVDALTAENATLTFRKN